ncbi:MAG: hypothetical protein ACRC42_01625 [Mycoplasma sp.]
MQKIDNKNLEVYAEKIFWDWDKEYYATENVFFDVVRIDSDGNVVLLKDEY